jgi:hypothetical protein
MAKEPKSWPDTHRRAKKTRLMLAALLLCLVRFPAIAAAQDTIYSADSLMDTFERGSKVSLKGAEILFRDVVMENKNSKVMFKSSRSGRVICDIVPTSRNLSAPVTVGSPLQVKGRVRGRGLLGNVTLDDCNMAVVNESAASVAPPPQEAASNPPEAVPEEGLILPAPLLSPASGDSAKELPPSRTVRSAAAAAATVRNEPVAPAEAPRQNTVIRVSSDPQRATPYALYLLLVLSGVFASTAFSKVLLPLFRSVRDPRPPIVDNSSATRQAALEALLLKAAKKR